MKLREYFNGIDNDEITNRLIYLDRTIMDMHNFVCPNGKIGIYYVGNDLGDLEIINNKIVPQSLHNKWNYLDSGNDNSINNFDQNAVNRNIIQVCMIGVCAYNRITPYSTKEFYENWFKDNLDKLLRNDNIPSLITDYYIDVFYHSKVDYLTNYLKKHRENVGNEKGVQKKLVKFTPEGKSYNDSLNEGVSDFKGSEREAAYVKVLIIPAILCLVSLVVVVTYFIFFR